MLQKKNAFSDPFRSKKTISIVLPLLFTHSLTAGVSTGASHHDAVTGAPIADLLYYLASSLQ
jgi:hypothetical protein